jgi:hypothetical protein
VSLGILLVYQRAAEQKKRQRKKGRRISALCLFAASKEESAQRGKKIKYLITKNPISRLSLANWHTHKYFQANAIADPNRIWPNKPNRKPARGKMLFA